MTVLEAVQRILLLSGQRQVTATDTGNNSPAGHAEIHLDIADEDIQSLGWPENTEDGVILVPDGSNLLGTTEFGTDVLFIETSGKSKHIRMVRRGASLYRFDTTVTTGTPWVATFTEAEVEVTKFRKLTFTDLPEYLANYIVADATWRFFTAEAFDSQIRGRRSLELRRRIDENLHRRRTTAEQHKSATRKLHLLNTPEAHRMRGRNMESLSILGIGV